MSSESGTEQVYIRPFDRAGPRIQISGTEGAEPLWSRDGRRVFYRTDDGRVVWAASLSASDPPVVTARTRLFEGNYDWDDEVADYDVTPNNEFIMVRFPQRTDEIIVSINWADKVRQKLREPR
jgi:hypothetical protein